MGGGLLGEVVQAAEEKAADAGRAVAAAVERADVGNWLAAKDAWESNWMDFTEGQLIDAKDDQGRWCEAEVTAVDEGRIHIHYLFWEQKHDEWVGAAQYPTRLAPASTAFYAKPKASRVDPEYFAAPKAKQWIDCFDIDPLTRYVEEKRSEEYAV